MPRHGRQVFLVVRRPNLYRAPRCYRLDPLGRLSGLDESASLAKALSPRPPAQYSAPCSYRLDSLGRPS